MSRAEISVHIGRGIVVNAGAAAVETYTAYDAAAERIAKQLRRYKGACVTTTQRRANLPKRASARETMFWRRSPRSRRRMPAADRRSSPK